MTRPGRTDPCHRGSGRKYIADTLAWMGVALDRTWRADGHEAG